MVKSKGHDDIIGIVIPYYRLTVALRTIGKFFDRREPG
jgi:hypothetical protein